MSGNELDDMTLEKFKFWKVPALEDFVKKEFVMCGDKRNACCTSVCSKGKNIPVEKTAPEREKILAQKFN